LNGCHISGELKGFWAAPFCSPRLWTFLLFPGITPSSAASWLASCPSTFTKLCFSERVDPHHDWSLPAISEFLAQSRVLSVLFPASQALPASVCHHVASCANGQWLHGITRAFGPPCSFPRSTPAVCLHSSLSLKFAVVSIRRQKDDAAFRGLNFSVRALP